MIFWGGKQNSCDVVLQIKKRHLFKLGGNGSKREQISLMITSIYYRNLLERKQINSCTQGAFFYVAPIKSLNIWQDN